MRPELIGLLLIPLAKQQETTRTALDLILVKRNLFRIPLVPSFIIRIVLMTITTISSVSSLKIAILTGSTRTGGVPRPILGPRICRFVENALEQRGHVIVCTINPKQLPLMEQPHFAYSPRSVPPAMQEMYTALRQADAYVTITPEFNHGPSPGLLNTFNHFGSSVFGFKPSLIVSYSASQWGGVRAAHALRPILSELGCLPVSSMIHFPRAQDVLLDDGTIQSIPKDGERDRDEHVALDNKGIVHDNNNRNDSTEWHQYMDRGLSQLEWWANAARSQRAIQDPYETSPAFTRSPSQRNTPT